MTIGSRVGTTDLLLKRVAHVPELNYNLVYLTALLKQTKGRLAADEHELKVFVGGGSRFTSLFGGTCSSRLVTAWSRVGN